MHVFSGDVTLPGDTEFVRRFNLVSELFAEWKAKDADDSISDGEAERAFNAWWEAKYALETGGLIAFA